jgi:hypothetical protein
MDHQRYERAFARHSELLTIGKLALPSGRVVACDPFFCSDARSFARAIPRGDYAVQIRRSTSAEWGARIGLARLLVRPNEPIASFEPAVRGPGDAGRFFVESGLASYMDEATRAAFTELLATYYVENPQGNYYTDILEPEFRKSAVEQANPLTPGDWNLHRLPGTNLDVAMFACGLGDSAYQSWWGLGASGGVVALVTDFGLE